VGKHEFVDYQFSTRMKLYQRFTQFGSEPFGGKLQKIKQSGYYIQD